MNGYLVIKIIQIRLINNEKKQFKNAFKFSNNDANQFILLLGN